MSEIPAYVQIEAQKAPKIEQVLPTDDIVEKYVDVWERQQAEFIIGIIRQKHNAASINPDALKNTVKRIIDKKLQRKASLPKLAQDIDNQIVAIIE
ncbi:MAG: hypothetical protein V4543_02380 [Bacteroidota bacterium]